MKIRVVCPKCNSALEVNDDMNVPLYIGKAQVFARNFSSEGDANASVLDSSGIENLNSYAIGERFYEYGFVMDAILKYDIKNKLVIDIGSAMTVLAGIVAKLGNHVTCVDFQKWNVSMDNIKYVQGDIIAGLPMLYKDTYDFGICVSTIEHVGMGRWKDPEDVNGDIKGMKTIYNLLKLNGLLVLTLPVGKAEVCYPAHRVYNQARLSKLLEGFKTLDEKYYTLSPESPSELIPCLKETAFNIGTKTLNNYNIACYLLEKV